MKVVALPYTLARNNESFTQLEMGSLGARVFTTMYTHDTPGAASRSTLFRFEWHIARLVSNAVAIGLIAEYQAGYAQVLATAATALQEAAPIPSGSVVKLVLNGSQLACLVSPYHSDWDSSKGISLLPVSSERSFPEIKSTSALCSVMARKAARAQGADEALLIDNSGIAREGAWTNFFWVVGEEITTCATGVLPGIIRRDIIENETCTLRDSTIDEIITRADEAFVTQSTTGITPVQQIIGKRSFATPGQITARLQARYLERINSEAKSLPL